MIGFNFLYGASRGVVLRGAIQAQSVSSQSVTLSSAELEEPREKFHVGETSLPQCRSNSAEMKRSDPRNSGPAVRVLFVRTRPTRKRGCRKIPLLCN